MSKLVNEAITLALNAHSGDRNKHDGELYLLHVHRVARAARVKASMFDIDADVAEAVGWLHDSVEDTPLLLSQITVCLNMAGLQTFTQTVVQAVDLLTKKQGESNEEYYKKIRDSGNLFARCVKLADLEDNFRRNHAIVDEDTKARMSKKYSLGMDILA